LTDKCAVCAGDSYDADFKHIPSPYRHCRLLDSYLLNLDRGAAAVHAMITEDIRRFREMGAAHYAADLEVVLACFVEEFATPRGSACEAAA
jgi:hypothetical protein